MADTGILALGMILSHAEQWGQMPVGHNRCRSVRRYGARRRERYLTPDEYRREGHTGRSGAVASIAGAGAAVGVMSEAIAFDSRRFVKNFTASGSEAALGDEQAHLLNSTLATEADLELENERVRSGPALRSGSRRWGAELQ